MIVDYNIKGYYVRLLDSDEDAEILHNKYKADEVKCKIIDDDNDFMFKSEYLDMENSQGLVFCTDEYFKKWLFYFDIIGYNYEYSLADDLLFNNKLDLSLATEKIQNIITEYIYTNFEANDVLDKINNNIELTELDYKILKNV